MASIPEKIFQLRSLVQGSTPISLDTLLEKCTELKENLATPSQSGPAVTATGDPIIPLNITERIGRLEKGVGAIVNREVLKIQGALSAINGDLSKKIRALEFLSEKVEDYMRADTDRGNSLESALGTLRSNFDEHVNSGTLKNTIGIVMEDLFNKGIRDKIVALITEHATPIARREAAKYSAAKVYLKYIHDEYRHTEDNGTGTRDDVKVKGTKGSPQTADKKKAPQPKTAFKIRYDAPEVRGALDAGILHIFNGKFVLDPTYHPMSYYSNKMEGVDARQDCRLFSKDLYTYDIPNAITDLENYISTPASEKQNSTPFNTKPSNITCTTANVKKLDEYATAWIVSYNLLKKKL